MVILNAGSYVSVRVYQWTCPVKWILQNCEQKSRGLFSITGCSGIQLNMDYVNTLVCVSVSLSLCVCKCVCIFVCVYLNVWLLRASERNKHTVVLSLTTFLSVCQSFCLCVQGASERSKRSEHTVVLSLTYLYT